MIEEDLKLEEELVKKAQQSREAFGLLSERYYAGMPQLFNANVEGEVADRLWDWES
jgi:hypothetical protein